MIAMFSIAIIGFAVGFANDTGAAISISDDPEMDAFDSMTRGNMSQFTDEAQDTYQSIAESTVESGSDVIKSSGSFTVTKKSMFNTAYNIIKVGNKKIFGEGSTFLIFFEVFMWIIGFLFALYIIKTWRGSP